MALDHVRALRRPDNGSERKRDFVVHRPVVVGIATLPARVEDRADEDCQRQRTKCDYQREHRLLLSAANGTTEQMPKCGMQRAELLHTMEWSGGRPPGRKPEISACSGSMASL